MALSRGDRRAELYAQLALADAYLGTTQRESEARYHTNQALAVTVALRYERGEVECRLRLAALAAQTDEPLDLRDSASRSLFLAERLGARHLEALARRWMAETLLREGEESRDEARREAENALLLAQELGFSEAAWQVQDLLARMALANGDAQGAEASLQSAVSCLEGLRGELRAVGLADTLLESGERMNAYARLVELLRNAGRAEEAAVLLERTGWPPLSARF
jgi:hypothetical protein